VPSEQSHPFTGPEVVWLDGTLDGMPVCASFQTGVDGLLWAAPPSPGAITIQQGTPDTTDTVLVQMPSGTPFAGEWFCAGNVVLPSPGLPPPGGLQSVATLSSLTRLGACPVTPVAGTVTLCSSNPNSGGSYCSGYGATVTSTLTTATFTSQGTNADGTSISDGIMGWAEDVIPASEPSGTELFIVYDKSGWSGPVVGGVLVIGPGNPDAGAVYCIGGGSTSETSTTHDFTLTGLSRLGTCAGAPAVGGSLQVIEAF
jgi:hypothetical protein